MDFRINKLSLCILLSLASGASYADCTVLGNELFTDNVLYYCSNIESYEKITINTSQAWSIAPLGGMGIYNSGANLKQVFITTSGDQSDGIQTKSVSHLKIKELHIKTSGLSADGVNLTEESAGGSITIGDNSSVEILGAGGGIGIRVNNASTAGTINKVTVGKGLKVITVGDGVNFLDGRGYALYAGKRFTFSGGPKGSSYLEVGDNSYIETKGSSAHAVFANNNGKIQLGSTSIVTGKANAHAVRAESAGTILLGGDTQIQTVQGGVAITASGTGSSVSSANAQGDVVAKYLVMGDVLSTGGGKINLALNSQSQIQGNLRSEGNNSELTLVGSDRSIIQGDLSATGKNSQINLSLKNASLEGAALVDLNSTNKINMTLDQSQWNLTKNSFVSNLSANRAKIYLDDLTSTMPEFRTLTVQNLTGDGSIFYMATDVRTANGSTPKASKLIVEGNSQGSHQFVVRDYDTGGMTLTGAEQLELALISDSQARFTLGNANGYVDLGAYKYKLDSKVDTDGEHWFLKAKDKDKTSVADHSANMLNINYLVAYAENSTLRQRLGELRESNAHLVDSWVRVYQGKMDSFKSSQLDSFDLDYSGMQMGVDLYIPVANVDSYVGVMAGYTDASADYKVGHGNVKSYHVGVYGTSIYESGWYIDTIARYNRMKNSLNTTTGLGAAVKGDGDTTGFSAGIESGKRVLLPVNGWYLEPQAQLTYSHQSSANIKSSNRLTTKLDSFESLLGRASVQLGYSINEAALPVDIYWRTGYLKEFKGKTGYQFNDLQETHEKLNMGGSWWENNIGVNVQLKQKHNLYMDATYSTGNKFKHKAINIGYRYNL